MAKIGVFDSGLGGLTVLADIHQTLPQADLVYIGDSAHAPYGEKTKSEITKLSEGIVKRLLQVGVEAIVIACNTATSAAAEYLRTKYTNIPIIGMEPALKPAFEQSVGGDVLVLATNYTLANKKYHRLEGSLSHSGRVISVAAPKLVDLAEAGQFDSKEIDNYLESLLGDFRDAESVVLGCTHFLYFKKVLHRFFGKGIKIFDGNAGVVRRINTLLPQANSGSGLIKITNTGSSEMAESSLKVFQKYLAGLEQ